MKRLGWFITIGVGLFSLAGDALAIDPRGIQITKDWSVVGVIADGDTNGIAVIRNAVKTFTVKVGDLLPENSDYKIKSVKRKKVILTDGSEDIEIIYQSPSKDGYDDEEPVSRFAESYFTGFTTVPLDYYKRRKETGDRAFEQMPFMMKKVPTDDGKEYEYYRREKPLSETFRDQNGSEEDVDESDVLIHYDNFSEEDDEEFSDSETEENRAELQGAWETVPKRALQDEYGE